MTEQTQDASAWPPRNVLMAGAVTLREDRALFVSQTYGSIKGQWGIPWGVVEAGESPAAAALRETREEGGIVARVEGLIGLQCFSWESAVGLVFLCRHVSGDPTPNGAETDRAAYFSLEETDEANQLSRFGVSGWSGACCAESTTSSRRSPVTRLRTSLRVSSSALGYASALRDVSPYLQVAQGAHK